MPRANLGERSAMMGVLGPYLGLRVLVRMMLGRGFGLMLVVLLVRILMMLLQRLFLGRFEMLLGAA